VLRYYRFLFQLRRELYFWNLRRRAMRQGIVTGRRRWYAAGVVMYGQRLIRGALKSTPEVVATVRMRPGAAVEIQTIDPRSEPSG
jgi:hypothetical protein